MADLAALCDDLDAEQETLDALVAPLDAAAWATPTPAEWTVRDTIAHLGNGSEAGRLAAMDQAAFRAAAEAAPRDARERAWLDRAATMSGPAVLEWWRTARAAMVAAYRPLDPATRIGWYGP